MAKLLDKSNIVTGQPVEAWNVSQSVDAFTGIDDYTIKISGSLDTTGSVDIDGNLTASGTISSSGTIYANVFNGMVSSSDQISSDISGSLSTTAIAALNGGYYSSSLQTFTNITASGNISASGNGIFLEISASGNISSSGNGIFSEISASAISASQIDFADGTSQTTAGGGGSSNSISQLNSNVTVTDTGVNGTISFETDGTDRWEIGNTGDFTPILNDSYDIGSSLKNVDTVYATNFSGSVSEISGSVSINNATSLTKSFKLIIGTAILSAGSKIITEFSNTGGGGSELVGKTLGLNAFIFTGMGNLASIASVAPQVTVTLDLASGVLEFTDVSGGGGNPSLEFHYQIMYF